LVRMQLVFNVDLIYVGNIHEYAGLVLA
jgi:hypothetical protein